MVHIQEVISRNNSCIDLNSLPKEPQHIVKMIALEDKISSSQSQDCQNDAEDAFLHYSNDQVRMTTLMLKDDDDEDSQKSVEAPPRRRQRTGPAAVERKTRISFELHHSLVMEEDLLAMFDSEDEDQDDEDDHCCNVDLDEEKMSKMSPTELLDVLLQM